MLRRSTQALLSTTAHVLQRAHIRKPTTFMPSFMYISPTSRRGFSNLTLMALRMHTQQSEDIDEPQNAPHEADINALVTNTDYQTFLAEGDRLFQECKYWEAVRQFTNALDVALKELPQGSLRFYGFEALLGRGKSYYALESYDLFYEDMYTIVNHCNVYEPCHIMATFYIGYHIASNDYPNEFLRTSLDFLLSTIDHFSDVKHSPTIDLGKDDRNHDIVVLSHLGCATIYLRERQFDRATEHVNQALEIDPHDSLPYLLRSHIVSARYNSALLKCCFDDIHDYDVDTIRKMRVRFYQATRDIQKSINLDIEIGTKADRLAFSYELLGRSWHGLFVANYMLTYLQETEDERDVKVMKKILKLLKREDQRMDLEAIENYTKNIDVDLLNENAYNYRGHLYMLTEQWKDALDDFHALSRLITEQSPLYTNLFLNMGRCYSKQGEHTTAISYFDKSLAISSNYYAFLERAKSFSELRQYDQAINELTQLMYSLKPQQHRRFIELSIIRGDCHANWKQPSLAILNYDRARKAAKKITTTRVQDKVMIEVLLDHINSQIKMLRGK
jgi:tetratricopeptide (TPR) repeat protein